LQTGINDRDAAWLGPLRARLADLYGEDASLLLADAASGSEAVVDVPYDMASSRTSGARSPVEIMPT
jgi:hypothetical protein